MKRTFALLLLSAIAARAGEAPEDPRPHLKPRPNPIVITDDPFLGEANVVHNAPSTLHRNWIARHPRLFGLIVVGAGAGVGAGIGMSQRRGVCTITYPNKYTYVGTNPCPGYK